MFSLILLSVTLVDNLINDNSVDLPIDSKVLYNAEDTAQLHYRLKKSSEQIEIDWENIYKLNKTI